MSGDGMVSRSTRLTAALALAAGLVVLLAGLPAVQAQITPPRGQNVAPAYEGWRENPDGSFSLLFGYFNRNWDEKVRVPVGADNRIEPGGPDQGQPTYFYPRRNRFTFEVRVPPDFGDQELIWTLTSNGETERAYGSLLVDYYVDDTVIMNNKGAGGGGGGMFELAGNRAPELRVEGPPTRGVEVGQPLQLAAYASDDGIPTPRALPAIPFQFRVTPDSASGLWVAWFVYRGAGSQAAFDPPQISVWEDMRDGSNSPWASGWGAPPAPPGGRWEASVTFDEPGTYVLRAWADDGGLMSYEDVTVVVSG